MRVGVRLAPRLLTDVSAVWSFRVCVWDSFDRRKKLRANDGTESAEGAKAEGDDDMFAVMKELVRNNYKRLIMPEHPRSMENDKGQKNGGYTGWVYNVGYARAMMQAALIDLRKS